MRIRKSKQIVKKFIGKHYIQVGKYTYGAHNIVIHFNSATLIIGKFCSISDNVHIFLGGEHNLRCISTYPFGHTQETLGFSSPIPDHPQTKGKVEIGNDVWIGSHASIMSGISIGDGAVIAARSHVISDVPPYSIFGGNPARLIRMRFEPELISELCKLKWWNLSKRKIKKVVPLLTMEPVDINLIKNISSMS
jgi:acetyltransferase-like isoleucine patch superfamily enzyme